MSLDFSSKVRVGNWKIPTLFDVWFGLNRFLEVLSFIGCTGANPGFFWRGLTDNECRNWLVRSTGRFHLRVVGGRGGEWKGAGVGHSLFLLPWDEAFFAFACTSQLRHSFLVNPLLTKILDVSSDVAVEKNLAKDWNDDESETNYDQRTLDGHKISNLRGAIFLPGVCNRTNCNWELFRSKAGRNNHSLAFRIEN